MEQYVLERNLLSSTSLGYFPRMLWNFRMGIVADPDFELRRGPGSILLAQPAFLPSVISCFFFQNKGGRRAPRSRPLDPPLGYFCRIQLSRRTSIEKNLPVPSERKVLIYRNYHLSDRPIQRPEEIKQRNTLKQGQA